MIICFLSLLAAAWLAEGGLDIFDFFTSVLSLLSGADRFTLLPEAFATRLAPFFLLDSSSEYESTLLSDSLPEPLLPDLELEDEYELLEERLRLLVFLAETAEAT